MLVDYEQLGVYILSLEAPQLHIRQLLLGLIFII